MRHINWLITVVLLTIALPLAAQETETKQEETTVELGESKSVADDGLSFQAPKNWDNVEPKVNMIEAEYAIEKADGDEQNGRMTVMGSGGSIDQNIERWYGQFTQPDGKATADVAKVEEMTINELTVHVVDISGTYADSMGGPFGPKTDRDNYRMLAAIVETDSHGNYFFKFYGPEKTVSANEAGFKQMLKTLQEAN
ncbi:MAG: hypothetical protein R3C03_13945 [Pirellulaceae bacterium]